MDIYVDNPASDSTAPIARNDTRPAAAQVPRLTAVNSERTQDRAPVVKPCPARRVAVLTRDLIAERAQAIWLKRGCPRNRDVENWREAEAQLKIELGIV